MKQVYILEESTSFQVWSATEQLGETKKRRRRGIVTVFPSRPLMLLGYVLLGKAFILAPHVGHWPFVCDDASPPSVWRFHTALTIPRLSWKYTGWQWQRSYSGGKSERKGGGQLARPLLWALCSLWPSLLINRALTNGVSWLQAKKSRKDYSNEKSRALFITEEPR